MSALVLIGGLAIELIGIVRTSQLTGRVIANLNRDASIALATAKRFESQIAEANQRAKSAEAEVASAKEQSAKAELGAAQARLELAKVQERLADRTISDAQLAVLVDEVKPFAGQEFEVLTYWSLREPLALTNRISAALNLAGWKYLQHQGFEGLYAGVAGVLLEISPSTNEQTKKAAATIAGALAKIGIASQVRAEPLTDSRIHFRIGTKP